MRSTPLTNIGSVLWVVCLQLAFTSNTPFDTRLATFLLMVGCTRNKRASTQSYSRRTWYNVSLSSKVCILLSKLNAAVLRHVTRPDIGYYNQQFGIADSSSTDIPHPCRTEQDIYFWETMFLTMTLGTFGSSSSTRSAEL